MNIEKIDALCKSLGIAEDRYSIIITSKNVIDEIVTVGNEFNQEYSGFDSDLDGYKIRGIYRSGHSLFFINTEDIDLKKFEELVKK